MFIRTLGSISALIALASLGLAQSATKPKWVDAQDLLVRTGGEKNFTKTTPKVGVEFYQDSAAGALVAITETGSIAVVPLSSIGAERKATWSFAHDLRCRKADQDGWKDAKSFGVEAFKYPAAKVLIYVSEARGLTLAELPGQVGADNPPAFQHGLVLKVRASGQPKFADAKTRIGVEAFKDGNTGGLIYITETGQLAAATAPPSAPDTSSPKRPTPLYGLEPQVRKADEKDFTKATKVVAMEVFKDPNAGGLLYVSEAGYIAAAPAPASTKDNQGILWTHAMSLKARKGGEKDFSSARKFGIEVFTDRNSGHTIYICETGSIAVLPRKAG
ncbi:MAG: hypothetical protein U0798_18995 [Gemmataceae bacterium]